MQYTSILTEYFQVIHSNLSQQSEYIIRPQELRNRLLAEETRRRQALLRLVESTERAEKTRVIGDLVECVDVALDAGCWVGLGCRCCCLVFGWSELAVSKVWRFL